MPTPRLKLNTLNGLDNFSNADRFQAAGLQKLDQAFLTFLQDKNPALAEAFLSYRLNTKSFSSLE